MDGPLRNMCTTPLEVDIFVFMFVTEYQSHTRHGAKRREVSEENSFPSHNILKTSSRLLVFLHDWREWIGLDLLVGIVF